MDASIPTLTGINGDADDDSRIRLTEAWHERKWMGDRMRFRMGKVDLTTDFDVNSVANSETEQFLSGGFVNNIAVEFPDDNGFGAMLWYNPDDDWSIGLAAAEADADWDDAADDLFSMIEVQYKRQSGGRQGNYRVYGWLNHKDHEKQSDPAQTGFINKGYGLSIDQEVCEFTTLFARYGKQRQSVSQIGRAWSVGLQVDAKAIGRDGDKFGIAYGQASIGSDRRAADASGGIDSGDECHLEVYYNYRVNDNLSLTPDFQWVDNPDGSRDSGSFWVFGVRSQLAF